VPDELAERLAGTAAPDANLRFAAHKAVLRVLRNSELAELWAEAAEDGGANEWQAEITHLIDRLNPDLEATPWEPAEIEQKVGQVRQTCAFCDQPVDPGELYLMTLTDASTKSPSERGLWLHLACLNARMHHKHAVANLKFDPKDMPDLD